MPLVIEPLPKGIRSIIDASVGSLVNQGIIPGTAARKATASTPMPIFHLGANAIAERLGLGAAERIGWVSILYNGREVLGTLELARGKSKRALQAEETAQFASFAEGGIHRALAMSIARANEAVETSELQLAILRAPALYLLALWLRSEGGQDSLTPVPPAPAGLVPDERYPADRLLDSLVQLATEAILADPTSN